MVASEQLKALRERKEQLVAESDALRASAAGALRDIGSIAHHWNQRLTIASPGRPWIWLAAAAAGVIVAKRVRGQRGDRPPHVSKPGLLARVLAGIQLYRTVQGIWHGVQSMRR